MLRAASVLPPTIEPPQSPYHSVRSLQVTPASYRATVLGLASGHAVPLRMSRCATALCSLISLGRAFRSRMQTSLLCQPAALSTARRQWRPSSSAAMPQLAPACLQLGNVAGGRPAGQRQHPQQQQQRRRLAAAAAASTAEPQAAAPTSQQRKELPKNFDPAASEEALYQWCVGVAQGVGSKLRSQRRQCRQLCGSGRDGTPGTHANVVKGRHRPGAACILPSVLRRASTYSQRRPPMHPQAAVGPAGGRAAATSSLTRAPPASRMSFRCRPPT